MPDDASFIFATCQVGAEGAVKGELARRWPELRLAFSRPGFLTFKVPVGHRLHKDLNLGAVFVRACGYSLAKVGGGSADELAEKFWQQAGDVAFRSVHVFSRDAAPPGEHDFEPGIGPAEAEAQAALERLLPERYAEEKRRPHFNRTTGRAARVLDCILVERDEWWIGQHRANTLPARWPGGIPPLEMPQDAVSRAYLKMEEALAWAQLPLHAGDTCVEIGAAPGGASQALLRRGLVVLGIDPAEVHPLVKAEPNFRHIKTRVSDLKRREFASARWLTADMNVVPAATLKAVESIVTHKDVHARGLILTLKLSDWQLAEQVPQWIEQVRSWGYQEVRARQLAYNRQEVCLAALKHRGLRRLGRRK